MIKLIAETAWHHDGDFSYMQKLVDVLIKKTKADIIKLHLTLDIDEYMSADHPGYSFLKQRLFTENQWERIIQQIKKSDKEIMLLFNDTRAMEFGLNFNPSLVEIHSVCLNDLHLLGRLKETNTELIPVVLGVGGSTLYEIENATSFLDTKKIVLMHGFQNYPTKYGDINFSRIRRIMKIFPEYCHGYADHTAWNEKNNTFITCMGAALGVAYIEKHVSIEPGVERTDWQAAISIEAANLIAENLKIINSCNGTGELKLNRGEEAYSVFGPNKKAAFLKNDRSKGEILRENDILFKRTAMRSDASQLDIIGLIGKKCKCDLTSNTLISLEDFV